MGTLCKVHMILDLEDQNILAALLQRIVKAAGESLREISYEPGDDLKRLKYSLEVK